jgi:hypothetical protein
MTGEHLDNAQWRTRWENLPREGPPLGGPAIADVVPIGNGGAYRLVMQSKILVIALGISFEANSF